MCKWSLKECSQEMPVRKGETRERNQVPSLSLILQRIQECKLYLTVDPTSRQKRRASAHTHITGWGRKVVTEMPRHFLLSGCTGKATPWHQGQGPEESHRCESFESKHVEAGRWAQEPTEQEKGTGGFQVEHSPGSAPGVRGPRLGMRQTRLHVEWHMIVLMNVLIKPKEGPLFPPVLVKHLCPRLEAQRQY